MAMVGDLSVKLEQAREWLCNAFKRNSFGTGWGHSPQEEEPSEWGGTLDGVRALLAVGEPALSPMISDSVGWLKSRQRPDGGLVPLTGSILYSYLRSRASKISSWLRASLIYLAVAALAVAQLRNVIRAIAVHFSHFIAKQSGSIWVNLISSAIWAFLVICGGLVMKKISHRNQG